jgi:hypothetical protein
MFYQFVNFLCVRILLHHLHTTGQSIVKILCGQSGGLPVGFGLSAVVDGSSVACSDSNEFVELGKRLRSIFFSPDKCNI